MQTAQELGLMSQKEYALHASIPESYVTELKHKGRIIFRPDPKTGKPKVDAEATDIILGKKAAPDFNDKLNKAADEKLENAITEKNANAEYLIWRAENEKLKYKIESGKYILKEDMERQGAELGSFIKSSVENLKAKIRNNYSLDIYQKLEKDLDSMLKKLAALDND